MMAVATPPFGIILSFSSERCTMVTGNLEEGVLVRGVKFLDALPSSHEGLKLIFICPGEILLLDVENVSSNANTLSGAQVG